MPGFHGLGGLEFLGVGIEILGNLFVGNLHLFLVEFRIEEKVTHLDFGFGLVGLLVGVEVCLQFIIRGPLCPCKFPE